MTSNRPYLLRALYEWISDNGLTPYLLVDAAGDGVRVPPGTAKDGRVVLNIAARAVSQLDMANEHISFLARFSGVSQSVHVPMAAVLAIYAQENGQGMMFSSESPSTEPPPPAPAPEEPPKRSHLRVVK
ncbi:ClpXP protease specificity-enhancing factor [Dokdonella sp.]|uniref:ClpXP protease specificity-enhancing factor n=1 Tax=Dokdonella sp. TaxID=2291710 RepID=UPI002634CA23|nr:ClpXP protease specificity-enhancing factor [Dokdonella sp.]